MTAKRWGGGSQHFYFVQFTHLQDLLPPLMQILQFHLVQRDWSKEWIPISRPNQMTGEKTNNSLAIASTNIFFIISTMKQNYVKEVGPQSSLSRSGVSCIYLDVQIDIKVCNQSVSQQG